LALGGIPPLPSSAGEVAVGIASVVDGDTIEIHGERIRLFGIDAAETRQSCEDASGKPYRCGQQAALALADRINQKSIRCEGRTRDRYGRLVAICYLGDEDLDAWLVSQGLALAFRKYSTLYVPEEDAARAAKRGLWAGSFEEPWEWRKGQH
jgi:endonuclease YncB( thermonuclease family)